MRHFVLGLALAIAIAGCGGESTGSRTPDSTAVTSDSTTTTSDSTTTTSDSSESGFPLVYPGPPLTIDILTEGILHIDTASQCVTLESPTDVMVVAIPEGAAIDTTDDAKPTLVLEGCTPMHDGARIQFRGVGSEADEEALAQQVDSAYLERCGATTEQLALIGYCENPDRQ